MNVEKFNYSEFDNQRIDKLAKYRKDLSYYDNEYWEMPDGRLIYAESDDDNLTLYSEVIHRGGKLFEHIATFAESFLTDGDVMHVFPEYMSK